VWNARSDAGVAASSGVYFALIRTPLGRRSARFVLLK
jgi:hypothetical protein